MQPDVTCRHMRARSDQCLVAALACANKTYIWRRGGRVANLVRHGAFPRPLTLGTALCHPGDELRAVRCYLQAHARAHSDECLVAALACANNTLAWRARRGIANLVKDEACPRILALWADLRPKKMSSSP